MMSLSMTHVLGLFIFFSVLYALWVVVFLLREPRHKHKDGVSGNQHKKGKTEIIGKSHFVLPRRLSPPEATTTDTGEKEEVKVDIFAPASVSEHPRQIPPEALDAAFGDVPQGEENPPLEIDYPLDDESFPDDLAQELEAENESLPIAGDSLAQGVSFESMGDAYRRVVHNPTMTDEQKQETGRVLLHLKGTDMFEALVSGAPDGNDKVTALIDTYLSAFQRRIAERSGESLPFRGDVPAGFDVRGYV